MTLKWAEPGKQFKGIGWPKPMDHKLENHRGKSQISFQCGGNMKWQPAHSVIIPGSEK